MQKAEKDKLCKLLAETLTLAEDGIAAHFCYSKHSGEEKPTLFAFTQARVFSMTVDERGDITLTPTMPIEACLKKMGLGKDKPQAVFPPPKKFDLMDPNCWKQISEYIRSIPASSYSGEK